MQVQVEIDFGQLLKIVKTLPASQLTILKTEIERGRRVKKAKMDLESLLLNGPVATTRQISQIRKNRKEINQWRKS